MSTAGKLAKVTTKAGSEGEKTYFGASEMKFKERYTNYLLPFK